MPALALFIMCLMITSCGTSLRFSKETAKASVSNNLRLNEINSNAANDFIDRFSVTGNEQWYKTNSGYLARFTSEGIATNVYYNQHGAFIKNIKYYKEADTPSEIKRLVTKKFPGYTVLVAAAISTDKTAFYQVSIANSDLIKTIEVKGKEIEILYEMRNGEIAYR